MVYCLFVVNLKECQSWRGLDDRMIRERERESEEEREDDARAHAAAADGRSGRSGAL